MIEANLTGTMQTIRTGLQERHPAGDENTTFVDAIYSLFNEFKRDYQDKEWPRIDDNEEMYHGDHWKGVGETLGENNPNAPQPSTPIITSTIENIKADLSEEFPSAVIEPDSAGNEVLAKVLTVVVNQELDVCGWDREYDKTVHDVLNCGWAVWEIGHDPFLNNGIGGAYIRYLVNKNFMCDPQCAELQDGRACFKMERKPIDWFVQHYPEQAKYMRGDVDLVDTAHDDFSATTAPTDAKYYRLIEAWFRVFDLATGKNAVHFVKVAGGQVLENSYESKPEGYYAHGMFPFVIVRLFPQKGSALGFGITDLFKDANRYSDKLDQILLTNAFRASRPRLFIQKGIGDFDDLRDFSKEVVEVDAPPAAIMQWQETQPLPAYIMNYIQLIREGIKTESGSNDQSRGQTASGVTAASAITALQEMSTKRSRMEARVIHYSFKEAVRMMIDVLREFAIVPRDIQITAGGQPMVLPFDNRTLKDMFKDGGNLPVEHFINIKTSRQTKYTKLMHNELWLQMLQTLGGMVDPVIMIEGLEYDEKEQLLDNVRKAQEGGMLQLQQQVQQLTQIAQEQGAKIEAYEKQLSQASRILDTAQEEPEEGQPQQEEGIPIEQAAPIPSEANVNPKSLAQAMY